MSKNCIIDLNKEEKEKLLAAADTLGKAMFPNNVEETAEFILQYFDVVLGNIVPETRNNKIIIGRYEPFRWFIDRLYKSKLESFANDIYMTSLVETGFTEVAAREAERYAPDVAAIFAAKELWNYRYAPDEEGGDE